MLFIEVQTLYYLFYFMFYMLKLSLVLMVSLMHVRLGIIYQCAVLAQTFRTVVWANKFGQQSIVLRHLFEIFT